MHHPARGIVLRSTKYTDNSLIVNMYTDKFGLQSYLVRGANAKSSKIKSNYFQGLTLLNMVVSKSEKHKLEHIKEIAEVKSFDAENDPVKNSICFFINELVYKTLHEEETNPPLFDFLANTLDILQLSTTNCVNFHLTFMLKYAQYRGFYPSENFSENNSIFDMVEGSFANELPRHAHFLDKEYSALVWRLMNTNYENSHQLSINNKQRKQLLLSLIDYYKLHNANTGEITSHLVLEQLF